MIFFYPLKGVSEISEILKSSIYLSNLRDDSDYNFNLMSLGLPQYTTGVHQLPQDSTEGTDEVSSCAKSCIWKNRRALNLNYQWFVHVIFACCFFCYIFALVNSTYVLLQGNCGGEGCSQGLPGVPGMASGKEEKGDSGKPGVTPMDSCDRVRLYRGALRICRMMWNVTNRAKCLLWSPQGGPGEWGEAGVAGGKKKQ